MEIAVPKISKSSKKFNRSCWWNPEIGEKKHDLNECSILGLHLLF
jgi:hypothetical protein